MGEPALPVWSEAPEWARLSTQASVDFVLENPEITAKELHLFWKTHRKDMGEDQSTEEDPSSRGGGENYENLPPLEQGKDILVIELVRTLSRLS